MIATKEQEKEALKKIEGILGTLGEGSYLSLAFEGCIEDAKANIEEDAAYSMKARYEKASKDAAYFKKAADYHATALEEKDAECNRLKKMALSKKDADFLYSMVSKLAVDTGKAVATYASRIVSLAERPDDPKFTEAVSSHREAQEILGKCRKEKDILRNIYISCEEHEA